MPVACVGCELVQHTQKEIICIRTPSSNFEDLYQVVELAVYVADNSNRGAHVYDIALTHEQLLRLGAYCLDHRLGEKLLFI